MSTITAQQQQQQQQQPPPLSGLHVLELAGLAPGPFTGLLLADYGASVLRIDRPAGLHPSVPTPDNLTRRKSSLALSLKSTRGLALFLHLVASTDILLDPYRPGVLEKLGLSPSTLLRINPRLIIARLTGFRRDGRYKDMAGHDINYIALAGVLAMLGRKDSKPYAPANLIGDFAGGGMTCFVGVLLALIHRGVSGQGQVVEANMVDGAAYLASMPRFAVQGPMWNAARGENVLDGGCPWYDTYETKDGGFVAVGCLEEKFYDAFVRGLGVGDELVQERMNRKNWDGLRRIFTERFKEKTRAEWEAVFDGTDACVTPVLGFDEMKKRGHKMRPVVDLSLSPGLAMHTNEKGQGEGIEGGGFEAKGLVPGVGGEKVLRDWLGLEKGTHYVVADDGGYELRDGSENKAKL